DHLIHLQYQTTPGGAWNSNGYTQFANPAGVTMVGDPAIGTNVEGRLTPSVLERDGVVQVQYQTTPGGARLSSGYTMFSNPAGSSMMGNPAIGRNNDGRQFLVVRGSDSVIHLQYQTTPGGGWLSNGYTQFANPAGISMIGDPAIGLSQ